MHVPILYIRIKTNQDHHLKSSWKQIWPCTIVQAGIMFCRFVPIQLILKSYFTDLFSKVWSTLQRDTDWAYKEMSVHILSNGKLDISKAGMWEWRGLSPYLCFQSWISRLVWVPSLNRWVSYKFKLWKLLNIPFSFNYC